MSTQTIERNYRKNPHKATFLQTFHSGISSTGRNYRAELATQDDNAAEYKLAAEESGDLLNLVEERDTVDYRSPAQAALMTKLLADIEALDAATGAAARKWTNDATAAGHWTAGRNGNASAWITRMIEKVREMRAAAPVAAPPAPAVEVADGRYAVEHEGTLKFYRVKNGHRAGFVFLDVQASDDWYGIRNLTSIREILALIAIDPNAAQVRYGQKIGRCYRCNRTLTDQVSRDLGIGPDCRTK
jgi:hypothetical protein